MIPVEVQLADLAVVAVHGARERVLPELVELSKSALLGAEEEAHRYARRPPAKPCSPR
jgi:hypothetical protein